jgi:lipid II:glycine glycyltransferase (peptidoglycan interpeptide bridge formation enzyme)
MQSTRFLQTPFWAQFKGAHGWKPLFFIMNGTSVAPLVQSPSNTEQTQDALLTVLVRTFKIGFTKVSIAYVPMAPEYDKTNESAYVKELNDIALSLKAYIPQGTMCVRFDPPIDFLTTDERDTFDARLPSLVQNTNTSLIQSPVAVQPPDTVLLSLDKTEEELLNNMKPKWRYNVKLAEKKGVTVTAYHAGDVGFDEAFNAFYDLFETTGKRDGISPHAKSYYNDLLTRGAPVASATTSSSNAPVVTLYLASHENDKLAGIITLFCGREAVYLYGASGNIKRNLMPAYLLQWTAICDAKKFGCPVYDFYGMPPTDDSNHPMHGLYLFKTGFGGTIIHRPGSFDVPLTHFYKWYIKAEKARAWYHRSFLKKIRGR